MRKIINRLFCFHPKWSDVKEDGFQYCAECNKAKGAPSIEPKQCQHKYRVIERLSIKGLMSGNVISLIYIRQCELCGELLNHTVKPEGTGFLYLEGESTK